MEDAPRWRRPASGKFSGLLLLLLLLLLSVLSNKDSSGSLFAPLAGQRARSKGEQ